MQATISKWGGSQGLRIPSVVIKALNLNAGDKVFIDIQDDTMIMKKEKSTEQMYEEFYGKPYDKIEQEGIAPASELVEWGEDVGGEVI